MSKFSVRMGDGLEFHLDAEAIDNVPEFMSELQKHGFVAGRDKDGPIAVCLEHVAAVRPAG
jgi:hypothetical protein